MKKLGLLVGIIMLITIFVGCGTGQVSEETLVPNEIVSSQTKDKEPGEEEATKQENTVDKEEIETIEEEKSGQERYIKIKFDSQALKANKVGEKTEKEVCIYLPPSYFKSDKSYPVVYYLHGYMEHASTFVSGSKKQLDEAFKNGGKEFILVGVNGLNQLGGSFYTNSPVSGNWEDYVVDEVVSLVDENFRTIKDGKARGICGFSMGGYGAYNIAFKHPDVFGAMLTMSPGLIADGDLPAALTTWQNDGAFKRAYSQAFSPNENDTKTYGNIPQLTGTTEDNAIVADWENGFGNINQKVEDYIALNNPLKAIKIVYGDRDNYDWIPRGCEFLSKSLDEHGIEHVSESFNGGHRMPSQVIEKYIVLFFNDNLVY